MNAIVQQMAYLYEQELFVDVSRLGELTVSICEQNQDGITNAIKFKLYIYYANALFKLRQFATAERAYSEALQLRKHVVKSKSTMKQLDNEKELISEIELKYKIHVCFARLKQNTKAIDILQSINAKARSPKINTALGTLYKEEGMDRPAINCFKEVLRDCPMAIGAAENLLRLGVRGMEVNSLILGPTVEFGWISIWLRGLSEMYTRDHRSALISFKSLDSEGLLKDNKYVLHNMAKCYNFLCESKNAIAVLQRVARMEPDFVLGRDLLAGLLANSPEKEHHKELERLIPDFDTSLWSSEHWVVLGYSMYVNSKFDRAGYFGQQACLLNKRNIEALVLKATTFMQINRYQEAANHFREALQYCPYRYDANSGLVHSYVAMNRLREAITVANNACKQMSNGAPGLTLYASVLLKDSTNNSKARGVLEKAIATDPNYSPPVFLLAELLKQERSYDDAISVLKRHVEVNPSSRVHQILGDCLVYMQKDDDAFLHYSIALRLDPQNQRALEGMNNIGRMPAVSKFDSSIMHYMSIGGDASTYTSQDTTSSDQDGDPDSDTDQWPSRNTVREVLTFD